jgi:thiosulfate/3-mercaptopyruvate sulfurtransferase
MIPLEEVLVHHFNMLVSTAELATHLDDPNWVIFDCRHDLGNATKGAEVYASGHIAGAYFSGVDHELSGIKTGTNGRHPLPDPSVFAYFLANCGVTAESQIVAYDDVGGQYAARLWWMTRWIGHPYAAVLDGGWSKWTHEGRPVSTEVPAARQGEIPVEVHPEFLATLFEVEQLVESGAGQVLDARAPERFRGEVEPLDPVAGHIPGAVNHFFKRSLQDDLTFKPSAEIRREFESTLGGRDPETVVHQCGSGITACVNLLAMELADLSGSKLYSGSWSEWVADSNRPVARG